MKSHDHKECEACKEYRTALTDAGVEILHFKKEQKLWLVIDEDSPTAKRLEDEAKAYTTLTDMIIADSKEELKLLREKAAKEFNKGFGAGWQRAFNYWASLLFQQVFSPEGLNIGSAASEERLEQKVTKGGMY